MKNRQLDATLQSAGLGVAAIRDLAAAVEIQVVEIPAALVDKIGAPYVAATIPANTYSNQTEDVKSAAVINYLATRSTLPDDLVYKMTKAMFDSLPELASAHVAGKSITLKGALEAMPVPLHPGAARYYKEQGMAVK